MSGPNFNAYSHYYDLLYRDKDYGAEVEYVDQLLERHGITGRGILEFGSGTGKHGRLLGERGYRVTGIERSAEMVEHANRTANENFTCRQGDICTVTLGRTFDAVLSLFHVVSYQVSNRDARAVFANAAAHLRPGGLFVFDVWYSPAVYAERAVPRIKRMQSDTTDVIRIAEPRAHSAENRIDVRYTILVRDVASDHCDTFEEVHPMRHFSLPELDLLAELNGFQRVVAEAFMSGEAPSESTWGVCVVLRKD